MYTELCDANAKAACAAARKGPCAPGSAQCFGCLEGFQLKWKSRVDGTYNCFGQWMRCPARKTNECSVAASSSAARAGPRLGSAALVILNACVLPRCRQVHLRSPDRVQGADEGELPAWHRGVRQMLVRLQAGQIEILALHRFVRASSPLPAFHCDGLRHRADERECPPRWLTPLCLRGPTTDCTACLWRPQKRNRPSGGR